MMVPSGSKLKVRSIIASLAAALLLAPGCQQDEATPQPPPNPVPRADLGEPVQPKLPRPEDSGKTKGISNVEKDLRKDLGGAPVIRPNTPTTTAPPAVKEDTKAGQP
jgi:hypothetical protein